MSNIGIIVNCLQGGGAERCAADLSVYFEQHGYKVIFFTDLSIKPAYEYKGELVHFTYKLDNGTNPLAGKVEELRELKDLYKIDIAISFMQFANFVNILSKRDEKIVLTTHSVNSEYAKYDKSVFWSDKTFRELYQFADVITFPSEYCRKDWLKHYGDKNGITKTIHNPVHAMNVDSRGVKHNTIITIGRMHSVKRQWHIIRMFKLVKEKYPDSRLIILGDGELRPQLEDLVKKLNLENDVEMPGNVKHVEDYLAEAKVFAMTSQYESISLAALEAMSAGVPVVTCDIPGGIREGMGIDYDDQILTEPIIGECGILVPYIKEYYTDEYSNEEIIFANEICYLLQNDELREEMAKKAKERVKGFALDVIGGIWENQIIKEEGKTFDSKTFDILKNDSLSCFKSTQNSKLDLYVKYYRLLENWMLLHEHGGTVISYFEKYRYENIIIYGLGKMAAHLIKDIENSQVNIICAIDKQAMNKYNKFPVVTEESVFPNAQCIVVTPVYEFEKIKSSLAKRTDMPIVSLTQVVEEALGQKTMRK